MSRCLRLKGEIELAQLSAARRERATPKLLVPERDILGAILALLDVHPRVAFAWRMNTGVTKYTDARGGERFVAFGFKGCADILGWLRGGRFFAIECKRDGEYPTRDQRHFLEVVNGSGGLGFVARSVDDVMREIQ